MDRTTWHYGQTPLNILVLGGLLGGAVIPQNAGLEQRIAAYRKQGKTVTAYDQQKELTALNIECPEYAGVYSHVLQVALDRLDKAYKGFFARVKRGDQAGFPRFKPRQRWNSFKFKEVWDKKKDQWLSPGKPVDEGRRINIPKSAR